MPRVISMIVLYMGFFFPLVGQQLISPYEGDISVINRMVQTDSIFIIKLLDSGNYFLKKQGEYPTDLDSSEVFFRKAIAMSDSLHFTPLRNEGLCLLGIRFFYGNQNREGKKYFMQAIESYQSAGEKEKEAKSWLSMRYYMHWITPNYPEILNNLHQSLIIYRQLGNKEQEIRVFKEMADVHLNQGKLDEAEKELLEVIDMYTSIGFENLHYTYDLLSVAASKGEHPGRGKKDTRGHRKRLYPLHT